LHKLKRGKNICHLATLEKLLILKRRERGGGEGKGKREGERIFSLSFCSLFFLILSTRIRRAIIVMLSHKALSTKNVRRTSKRECGFEHEPFLLSRITVEMRAAREATKYVTFNDKAAGNTGSRYFSSISGSYI